MVSARGISIDGMLSYRLLIGLDGVQTGTLPLFILIFLVGNINRIVLVSSSTSLPILSCRLAVSLCASDVGKRFGCTFLPHMKYFNPWLLVGFCALHPSSAH